MLFNIAFNNVKKSYKDYTIYFLTLTLGVCVFYSFNSIESQTIMGEVSSNKEVYMELVKTIISIVSVFVSFILGGLIVYANNFLIKKRKKELGIYMTLGMGKKKISLILVIETFIIGLFSLIIGLLLGLVVSQGLSVLTAKLFEVNMDKYRFVISVGAMIKTALYFGIIFLIIMIFNSFIIAKYNLIDLLYAARKNEKIKVRSSKVSAIIFILSMIILAYAYYKVNSVGRSNIDLRDNIIIPVILGTIGSFIFFLGLSGVMLNFIQRKKKLYYKGLNSFVVKQMNNKINSNFMAMAVISIMLFITIVSLSTGVGYKKSTEETYKDLLPFDATIEVHPQGNDDDYNFNKLDVDYFLNEVGFKFIKEDSKVNFKKYYSDGDIGKLLSGDSNSHPWVDVISIDDYNNILALQGKDKINIKENEFLVISSNKEYEKSIQNFIDNKKKIKVNEKEYTVANKKIIKDTYKNISSSNSEVIVVVLPMKAVENLSVKSILMNVNSKNPELSYENFLKLDDYFINSGEGFFIYTNSKIGTLESKKGSSTIILYIGLYLGIIFLLASSAVLSLQQLSEASDSLERYNSLRKIGVSETMIDKAIFKQVLIYFTAPLILAFVDSIFGIMFIKTYLMDFGKVNIIEPTIITLIFLMLIYTTYFVATYISYKNTVKS